MYRRYSNPMELLSSLSMDQTPDFMLFILDKEQDDTLWELWLAKDVKDDFKTFKKKNKQVIRKKQFKTMSAEQELENVKKYARFIKPKEGGEMNG